MREYTLEEMKEILKNENFLKYFNIGDEFVLEGKKCEVTKIENDSLDFEIEFKDKTLELRMETLFKGKKKENEKECNNDIFAKEYLIDFLKEEKYVLNHPKL